MDTRACQIKRFLIISLYLVILFVSPSFAQDGQSDFSKTEDTRDWGFSVTPYALLAANFTDVGGQALRQSFSDLTSITNAGFQIIAKARYKRLFVSFDGTFATLGINEQQGPLQLDVEIRQRIFDLKAGYRVYSNFDLKSNDVIDGWSIDINVGGKYWNNNVNVAYAIIINDEPILEDNVVLPQEWWDLMAGVSMKFVVSPRFLVGVAYNAGGFGIGNSSKFAYDFTYVNSFKVHKNILINAGFRSFMYRRVDITDGEELTTKVTVLGPMLGVSFML